VSGELQEIGTFDKIQYPILREIEKALFEDWGDRRELEKKAKAEGGRGIAVRDLPLSIAFMLC